MVGAFIAPGNIEEVSVYFDYMTIDCTKDFMELVKLLLRVELGDLLFIDLHLQNAVANCSKELHDLWLKVFGI